MDGVAEGASDRGPDMTPDPASPATRPTCDSWDMKCRAAPVGTARL